MANNNSTPNSTINKNGSSQLDSDADPVKSARQAGLRYVNDEQSGIRRRRCGRGFTYSDAQGKTIRDPKMRQRFDSLAIPPAWADVWICADESGHIQAYRQNSFFDLLEEAKDQTYGDAYQLEELGVLHLLGPNLAKLSGSAAH